MSQEKNQEEIEITKDVLANFLKEAEEEHAKYEEDLGHKDEDWHLWYADYILQKFEDLSH